MPARAEKPSNNNKSQIPVPHHQSRQQQQHQSQIPRLPNNNATYQPQAPANKAETVPKKSNLKKSDHGKKNDRVENENVFRGEAAHAKQNTAMLVGQSLPTNSVQNLLVGKAGEHIADNVLHLFREFYTDPAVMSRLPRLHQNDAVHRQLASFQRIIDEMEAHFSYSPSRLHAILIAIINDAPHAKNMLRLGRLKEIFEEKLVDAQKVTGYLRDSDKRTKSFFEHFLNELNYHKRLRLYFCERIYCPLYQYYYDEFDDRNAEDDYAAKVAALAKLNRAGRQRQKGGKSDLAEGDLILNKREYLLGNYKAVNSWSEKHKLSYAVEHMRNLERRWEALLDDNGVMAPEDYEPESSENMDQLNNYPAFEPILRLVPDLYVKTRKAVELATLWWTAGNKLFPANPDQMVERPDALLRINELKSRVHRLTDELAIADRGLIPYQHDLDALLVRDDHFNRLAADYENLASTKREKLDRHQKLEDRVSELESQSPYWTRRRQAKQQQQQRREVTIDPAEELQRVRMQVDKSFRSLRLTAYQFEIVSGDYLAELTVRPTFVRFLDTCQHRLTTSESDLGERRDELMKLQRELNTLTTNNGRRREILEKYMSALEGAAGGETRAAERSRVAMEQHQQRLHNKAAGMRAISPPSARAGAAPVGRNNHPPPQPAGNSMSRR